MEAKNVAQENEVPPLVPPVVKLMPLLDAAVVEVSEVPNIPREAANYQVL